MRAHAQRDFHGTVLVADDHAVFRVGLVQLLRSSLKIKRFLEAESLSEVTGHLKDQDLALAIIDLRMPGMTGAKDLERIRHQRPDVQIVVVSASEEREDILHALEAGVHGYIVKSQHTDQLIVRLRYILSGEIYVPPSLAEPRPLYLPLSLRSSWPLRFCRRAPSSAMFISALRQAGKSSCSSSLT